MQRALEFPGITWETWINEEYLELAAKFSEEYMESVG